MESWSTTVKCEQTDKEYGCNKEITVTQKILRSNEYGTYFHVKCEDCGHIINISNNTIPQKVKDYVNGWSCSIM
jgi:hypothetical protein